MDDEMIKYMIENANKCIECKDYIHPSRNEIICTRCRKQNELLEEMKNTLDVTLLSVAIEIRDLLKELLKK